MKILILVIYSDNCQYYKDMLKTQRRYIHKNANVDVYFVKSGFEHNEEVFMDNDMIHVRGKESHSTILYKCLRAMETLKNFYKKEYDFTIRTNISTLIDIPKLIELVSLYQSNECLYAGDIVTVERFGRPIRFALGTAIILSKKLAYNMIEQRHKFNHTIEDDVSFGLFVEENMPIAFENDLKLAPFVFYTSALCNCKNAIGDALNDFANNNNLNYIFYRNSSNNRYTDVMIMNFICDKQFIASAPLSAHDRYIPVPQPLPRLPPLAVAAKSSWPSYRTQKRNYSMKLKFLH